MSVTKQLNTIDERIAATEREVRELVQREREAQAELAAPRDALAAHFEQEAADPTPSKLHNNLTAARNKVEQPWAERQQGLGRRLAKLRQERGRFLTDNLPALIEAQEDAAHPVRDQAVGATRGD